MQANAAVGKTKYPLGICIGGIQFSVQAPSYSVSWDESFRPFFGTGDTLCTIQAESIQTIAPSFSSKDLLFEAATWSMYGSDRGKEIIRRDVSGEPVVNTAVFLDSTCRHAQMRILDRESDRSPVTGAYPCPLDGPIGVLLSVLVLGQGMGIMIHACGVDDEGKGYLFAGPSGRGKSTMASLWECESRVLNDERIVIARQDGQYWLHSTPWHGTYRKISARSIPLTKIFFLNHGTMNRAVRKESSDVVSSILPRCYLPIWDKTAMEKTLSFCSDLALTIPCWDLDFAPDSAVLDMVRCVS